jgi:ankyrin repeat protein
LLSINDENVNYVDEDGDTFLIHFCRYNIPELSNNLLVLDSKPEQVNKNNLTALLWACRYRMHILALNILNYECNPGQADDNGCTALMYACKFKMSEVALKILNFKCKGTALAVTGLTRVREQDPSIDVRQVGKFDSGLDPLSYTVAGKPEQVSNIGYTALMYACSNNMYEVALKILNFDCKTEQVGNDGYTALIYACEYNMPELAFKILNREYDSTPH